MLAFFTKGCLSTLLRPLVHAKPSYIMDLFSPKTIIRSRVNYFTLTKTYLVVRFYTKNKTFSVNTLPKYFYMSGNCFRALVGLTERQVIRGLVLAHRYLLLYTKSSSDLLYKNSLFLLKIPLYRILTFRIYRYINTRSNRKYRRIKRWLHKQLIKSNQR